ncbi:AMP-binding protein [Pseudohoeflea coraliihabitans]|uniref:AMP-binding protein n=1 Tax=Pseudohoeflea coraliihabitans TaxID=2860393 RepID=A0ABS6WR37_9HYPH|nr:AMP-binding protein [Pseudohoeflea sp. DP4N28-3]MBW3098436.1 AMP-binding protein [Pseudohoeflea sp. DP4N28-3]
MGVNDWTLDRALKRRCALTPDKPFILFEDAPALSFSAFSDLSRGYAATLHRCGVRSGQRIALLAGNSIEHIAVWFAANLLGAADAPINPNFSGRLLAQALIRADTEIVIADAALLPALAQACRDGAQLRQILTIGDADVWQDALGSVNAAISCRSLRPGPIEEAPAPVSKPGDVASILFTSGTTGPPKGVMVTQAQGHLTARQTINGLRVVADDVFFCAHPLFHMSPRFCVIYAALLSGARVCFDRRFSASGWIDRIRATGATVTIGHGPLLEMIYAEPERANDAETRLTRIGTAPFPKHIALDFERRFGVKGIETWGMTEINIPFWHPYDEPLKLGSCGRLSDDRYEFAILDPETDRPVPDGAIGEFAVRTKLPGIISPGYLGDPEATAQTWRSGWFHSGDSGYLDADGWLFFVDRLGDRIRRRAENISSYDIEFAANLFPAVQESAAIGVPSGFASDEDIMLCVLVRPDQACAPIDLLAHLARELPHAMVPRYIEILDEMPRTPTQKIRKAVLRQQGVSERTWDRKAAGIDLRDFIEMLERDQMR